MAADTPPSTSPVSVDLTRLGQQIRLRRKALGVNATVAAESAGMSRVTWHRIERGEPSVAMGAYCNALAVLGLMLEISPLGTVSGETGTDDHEGWIPAHVRLADYPQLKRLAWQVQGVAALSPREAFDIYERNTRHLDTQALDARERNLINALQVVFEGEAGRV